MLVEGTAARELGVSALGASAKGSVWPIVGGLGGSRAREAARADQRSPGLARPDLRRRQRSTPAAENQLTRILPTCVVTNRTAEDERRGDLGLG